MTQAQPANQLRNKGDANQLMVCDGLCYLRPLESVTENPPDFNEMLSTPVFVSDAPLSPPVPLPLGRSLIGSRERHQLFRVDPRFVLEL